MTSRKAAWIAARNEAVRRLIAENPERFRQMQRDIFRDLNPDPITRLPWASAQHGTSSGYVRHRQLGETACDECKAARWLYQRNLRARKD